MEKMLSFDDLTPAEFAEKYNTLVGTKETDTNGEYHFIESITWTQYISGPPGTKGSGLFLVMLEQRPAPAPGTGPRQWVSTRPERKTSNRSESDEPPL